MRRFVLAAAVSAVAAVAGYGQASAQVVIEGPRAGVYIGPGYSDDYYDGEYYGPRVYGYSDDSYAVRDRDRYTDRVQCGRGAYWNGQVCIAGRRP